MEIGGDGWGWGVDQKLNCFIFSSSFNVSLGFQSVTVTRIQGKGDYLTQGAAVVNPLASRAHEVGKSPTGSTLAVT